MGQSQRQVCKSKWSYWNRRTAVVQSGASPQPPDGGFGQAAGLLSGTCLPGRHGQPRTSQPGCPLWDPALEQGTAGAVITQGCVWPVPLLLGVWHPQVAHVAPQSRGDDATFGMGNDMLGVGSLLALLLQFLFTPFTLYNPKITPKFPNSLWVALLSDFTVQSSLG